MFQDEEFGVVKPEPGTLVHRLGSEERVEDGSELMRFDPAAVVLNAQAGARESRQISWQMFGVGEFEVP